LKIVAAVQAGTQDEMTFLERTGASEDIENLFLDGIHEADAAEVAAKNKNILHAMAETPMVLPPC
jgi:hypothetical protein